ncbi:IS6 family transposase [Noviherbaspirillum aerium]|uniref:IS6 family transposase n=1 Tax=Noviherbaspirillum aerium TaxID=2588497 RepID=UPI00384C747D
MLTRVRWCVAYPLSLRMDETYMFVGGQWKYPYRAVDRDGAKVDFLLTAKRDLAAARRFLEHAIGRHGLPDKIAIDKSGTNTAAIKSVVAAIGMPIELRQVKYLNNPVEQDQRAVKRIIRPMPGFRFFRCAHILLAGIETMHRIKKGYLDCPGGKVACAAGHFYSLAA